MDLVDEEDVAVLEVGQQRGEVARPSQDGTGRDAQAGRHLGGDDAGQRGLAQTGGAGEEDVVDRLAALPGRLQHDAEMLDQLRLTDELLERPGPEPDLLELLVRVGRHRVHDPRRHPVDRIVSAARNSRVAPFHAVGVDGQDLPTGPGAHRLASSRSARRSISSTPTSSRRPSSAPRISSGPYPSSLSAARASERDVRVARCPESAPFRLTPAWSKREVGQVQPALQLNQQPRRRLATHAGHGAQRVEIVLEHRGRQRRWRQDRHDGERQRGADAVRAQEHLEAAALVVVHEPVEDDGVLADVGVHEQLGLGSTAVPVPIPARHQRGRRRRRDGHAVADAGHVDDYFAVARAQHDGPSQQSDHSSLLMSRFLL